ncbi:MAG: hypothetical protein WCB20_13755 [Chthoniobacterales bacterium]|jgi:hypothetical protein
MKPPLIFLFTRDDDFAQSVREPLFGTGAVVLGLTILVAVSSYFVRGSTHHPSSGNAKSHTRAIAAR